MSTIIFFLKMKKGIITVPENPTKKRYTDCMRPDLVPSSLNNGYTGVGIIKSENTSYLEFVK